MNLVTRGVYSKEIIRSPYKCVSKDFTMELFKKEKRKVFQMSKYAL